jgi:hypothetical protein
MASKSSSPFALVDPARLFLKPEYKCNEVTFEQMNRLKGSFIKNKHPRFKKEFAASRHQPFGNTSDYIKGIENAESEKLARLIKIVGMLMQTKVYLFWRK